MITRTILKMALGLDVSKLTIDVCFLSPEGEKRSFKVPNSIQGFRMLLACLEGLDFSEIHACLEPTGRYSRPLSYFLAEAGIPTSLVNSFAVQSHGRGKKFRSKSDRIDAYLLADYCLKERPPYWTPPASAQSELKDMVHRLACVEDHIRQEENRLEAGTDSQVVRDDIEDSLGRLYVSKKKLEKALKQHVQTDDRLMADYQILTSIIGLGEKSTIRLLSMVQFNQFKNGRQVACFAGLTPGEFESGTSVHKKAHISRMGSSELRAALYYPAMVAIQHNPQMRSFADRLRSRGKPPKVVICAVMRKLLVVSSALIRKQQMYDPSYFSSIE